MSYVRVDWDNGEYSYFKNDTECGFEWRSAFLLHNHFYYKRIRRIQELPEGKKCIRYKRHNKAEKDWEIMEDNKE